MTAPAQPALDAMMEGVRELRDFLNGDGQMRGKSFGDRNAVGHAFWWRGQLYRLDQVMGLVPALAAEVREQRETIAGLTARVEAMTRALTAVVDGDVPRPVKEPWSGLDTPSKHDICPHDMPMWQDCPNCISDFARATLSGDAPNATDR
jgi:hypothetical protein